MKTSSSVFAPGGLFHLRQWLGWKANHSDSTRTDPKTRHPSSLVTRGEEVTADDDDASNLVSFPIALTVTSVGLAGLVGIAWGFTISNVWVLLAGLIVLLLGCAAYGWILEDER